MPHIFLTVHLITVLGRLQSKDSESFEAGEEAKKHKRTLHAVKLNLGGQKYTRLNRF